jgi:hypothetical protein
MPIGNGSVGSLHPVGWSIAGAQKVSPKFPSTWSTCTHMNKALPVPCTIKSGGFVLTVDPFAGATRIGGVVGALPVELGVGELVIAKLAVRVRIGSTVSDGVGVHVSVGISEGVSLGVSEGVAVAVSFGVSEGVSIGVSVDVA